MMKYFGRQTTTDVAVLLQLAGFWFINISKYQYLNVETESSILSCRLLLMLKQNISRSYFLIIAVCNRIQYFSNPVMMKYFWKTNYHRCRCSVAASWILVYQYFKILISQC
ncbi:Hypothetical_protein [Hexamita inflata]|uniref:Hypothetical_protein n=1 Tax=Hexamita inflata TaxID=28002 RepID=A0AA86N815_9EUKA|nr:Hypothetical protein HINF_LOCUS2076 [Hexamita inflata]